METGIYLGFMAFSTKVNKLRIKAHAVLRLSAPLLAFPTLKIVLKVTIRRLITNLVISKSERELLDANQIQNACHHQIWHNWNPSTPGALFGYIMLCVDSCGRLQASQLPRANSPNSSWRLWKICSHYPSSLGRFKYYRALQNT